MKSSGFDNQLLPGGAPANGNGAVKDVSALWQTDLEQLLSSSGTNLTRKIRESSIRGAIVLGENPAAAEKYNKFIDNLDFLVVSDMFRTETVQMADVFLPASGYLETEGHLTDWSGHRQYTKPIGEPLNGVSNVELIKKLATMFGTEIRFNKFEEIVSEIDFITAKIGPSLNGSFPTADGKIHFVPYSSEISTISAKTEEVLEIDRRISERIKLIST